MRRIDRGFVRSMPWGDDVVTRKLLVIVLWVFCVSTACADQYEYVTLRQATKAMEVIGENQVVQSFCAPCGETMSRPVPVELIELGRIWEGESAAPYESDGETFWEVLVNGERIDLAYLYVRSHGGWENLAVLLGLEPVRVPRYLGAQQLGR